MNPANPSSLSGIPFPSHRRPAEPPAFWLCVLAGSVLIHLVSLLAIRLWTVQKARVELATAPMAVEFIQPAPVSIASGTPTSRRSTSTVNSAARSLAPTAAPAPRTEQDPQPAPLSEPGDSLLRTSRPARAPIAAPPRRVITTPDPVDPVPRLPQPIPSPSPLPARRPRPLSSTPPRPIAPSPETPFPPQAPSTPPEAPVTSGSETPESSLPRLPGDIPTGRPPAPSPSQGSEEPPPVSVSQEREQGSGLRLTILGVASGNSATAPGDQGGTARGDYETDVGQVPQVISQPKSFDGIAYPASVRGNLGRSITLLALIDREGNLRDVFPVPEERVPREVSDFVKELLMQSGIQFSRPTQDGQPVERSQVKITLTLDSLP